MKKFQRGEGGENERGKEWSSRTANLGVGVGWFLVGGEVVGAVHMGVVHVVGEIGAGGWMHLSVILFGAMY